MLESLSGQAKIHSQDSTFNHDSGIVKINSLLPSLDKSKKILDVGCGDARLSSLLLPQVNSITGLDVHQKALAEAKRRGLETIQTDIERHWPLNDSSFDIILLLDVLEHVSDCEFVLNEAKRVLKESGTIIVAFPNHFDIRSRLEILFGRGIVHWSHRKYEAEAWRYAHVRFLTLDEIKKLCEQVGLHLSGLQLNFMGGGIVPTRFSPKYLRKFLVNRFPNLFAGKFTLALTKQKSSLEYKVRRVIIDRTLPGM
jgi:methionine biosynthesis protein MetW